MSVIIGIDPGFASLGWATLELRPAPSLLALGLVRTKKGQTSLLSSEDNVQRLRQIYRALVVLGALKPVAIAIESQSWPRNASAAAKVASVWGIIATLAELWSVPLIQVQPMALKVAVTGDRKASKDDVLAALKGKPGFGNLGALLDGEHIPESLREHPVDAAGAILAALDTELGRAVGAMK